MKLLDLDAQLYRYEKVVRDVQIAVGDLATWHDRGNPTRTETRTCYDCIPVSSIAEAQSIWFLCPKCINGSHHMIECTIAGRGVEDACGTHNKAGQPVRWAISGDDLSNLSLQPSVLIEGGCAWHGFVTNGEAK